MDTTVNIWCPIFKLRDIIPFLFPSQSTANNLMCLFNFTHILYQYATTIYSGICIYLLNNNGKKKCIKTTGKCSLNIKKH